MTKLATTPTASQTKPAVAKGKQPLLQTITLFRSIALGKDWDRFEPTSTEPDFPYTLLSCGQVSNLISIDQHVLHGWTNEHRSPYISFAGPNHQVAATWYHLKQEYMRLTYGARPSQAGRYAPRALYKIQAHAEDVTRVQSTNPKVSALTAAMDERVGSLRVRVASFEEIVVPEKLKYASFAWFAATYRCNRAAGTYAPRFKLTEWRADMETMARVLQDLELMAYFGMAMPGSEAVEETVSDSSDSDSDPDSDQEGDSDSDSVVVWVIERWAVRAFVGHGLGLGQRQVLRPRPRAPWVGFLGCVG